MDVKKWFPNDRDSVFEASVKIALLEQTPAKQQMQIESVIAQYPDVSPANRAWANYMLATSMQSTGRQPDLTVRKFMAISNDPDAGQKLDAYISAQQFWAEAFAKRQVPKQVFGGQSGAVGGDSDIQTFMDIMTMKAARDLNFDPAIESKGTVQ